MKKESKSIWGVILKVVIAISTTLAGIFGLSCLYQIDVEIRQFLSKLSGGSPPDSSLQRHTL